MSLDILIKQFLKSEVARATVRDSRHRGSAGPDGVAGTRRQSFAITVQQAAVCRPVLTAGINKKQLALPVVAGLIQR
jgi:hypothetical protein